MSEAAVEPTAVSDTLRDRLSNFRNTLADYADPDRILGPHYDCPECGETSHVDEFDRAVVGVVYSIQCSYCGEQVAVETPGERRRARDE